jgi:hypothetical protein
VHNLPCITTPRLLPGLPMSIPAKGHPHQTEHAAPTLKHRKD